MSFSRLGCFLPPERDRRTTVTCISSLGSGAPDLLAFGMGARSLPGTLVYFVELLFLKIIAAPQRTGWDWLCRLYLRVCVPTCGKQNRYVRYPARGTRDRPKYAVLRSRASRT